MNQSTGKIKNVEPAESDDKVLFHAQAGGGGCVELMDKQLAKMKKRLLEGENQDAEDEEGGEEEVPESDDTLSVRSDYNVHHSELVEVSDEEVAKPMHEAKEEDFEAYFKAKAVEESKEVKSQGGRVPRSPFPRQRKCDKDKEDERPSLERKVPVKGKSKSSAASVRPDALSKGTLRGKGKGRVVPTRPAAVSKDIRREEGDDSEDESPAKPSSSRPSRPWRRSIRMVWWDSHLVL